MTFFFFHRLTAKLNWRHGPTFQNQAALNLLIFTQTERILLEQLWSYSSICLGFYSSLKKEKKQKMKKNIEQFWLSSIWLCFTTTELVEYYYQQDFIEFFIFYFYESVDLRKLSPCSLVLISDGADKLCENNLGNSPSAPSSVNFVWVISPGRLLPCKCVHFVCFLCLLASKQSATRRGKIILFSVQEAELSVAFVGYVLVPFYQLFIITR